MKKDSILLLDDDLHILWTLKTFLEAEGYTIYTADTIDTFKRLGVEVGASTIITEYWLQNAKTLEIIQAFKEKFPEAYVMMITNNQVTEEEYKEIIKAGVDDYFLKPFPNNKMLIHLEKGLRQRNLFLQNKRLEEEIIHMKQGSEISNPLGYGSAMNTPGT
jgi:DNA-binding NtrC family response regulator